MKTYKLNGTFFYCPVDLTLSVIGGRWQGLIIWALRTEPKRFNALKKELVAVNDKMLSQTLKTLVEQGVVSRTDYNSMPPHVEYALTKTGKELLGVFELMEKWGTKNSAETKQLV
jgi:DNA-binding HxlR family transcriptional regulator